MRKAFTLGERIGHAVTERFHLLRVMLLLTMVLLFAQAVLLGEEGAVRYYRERERQQRVSKGVESINNASNVIIDNLTVEAKRIANGQYETLYELLDDGEGGYLSEKELSDFFKAGYANGLKEYLGSDSTSVTGKIDEIIRLSGIEGVRAAYNGKSRVVIERDSNGVVYGINLRDITLIYDNPSGDDPTDTFNYNIRLPDAVFYNGNEDLFEYCLVSKKGLYISGATSSVIGDIYAGDHLQEELRDAEIGYGEYNNYGGINILSTQLGVQADRIISKGDININGSFVILASQGGVLNCYGHRLNKIEGFKEKSVYSLDGIFFSLDKTDEKALDDFYEYEKRIDYAAGKLDKIEGFYDSKNDSSYEGIYRKIISDTDVEIKEDFTGVVLTPYNVIINPNVNFEGLILCGDRIYVGGNNNIVSNRSILQRIVKDEIENRYMAEARDFIGGMTIPGISFSEHLVVPFR